MHVSEWVREKNLAELAGRRVGLFTCAANEPQLEEQLKQNFPAGLVEIAQATGNLGHAIYLEKMNFMERMIVKTIMKTKQSSERISEDNIDFFAKSLRA